jgi:hypothetical protein
LVDEMIAEGLDAPDWLVIRNARASDPQINSQLPGPNDIEEFIKGRREDMFPSRLGVDGPMTSKRLPWQHVKLLCFRPLSGLMVRRPDAHIGVADSSSIRLTSCL